MNRMGIITTEYHVVDAWVVSYGHIQGVSTIATHGIIRGINYGCSV